MRKKQYERPQTKVYELKPLPQLLTGSLGGTLSDNADYLQEDGDIEGFEWDNGSK